MKLVSHSFLLILITGILSSHSNLIAAETTYAGTLKGVECTGCKQNISKAIGKIKGVKTIRIVKKTAKKHRLEVITDGTVTLTKDAVASAISGADHYKITSWGKED